MFELLRCSGVVYLVWLGARLVLSRGNEFGGGQPARHGRSAVRAMRGGLITNLGNPNPIVFMLAFLPQFVTRAAARSHFSFWSLVPRRRLPGFSSSARLHWPRARSERYSPAGPVGWFWQRRIAGAVMIGLGLRLMLTGELKAAPN
ncbi:MAG: LysE family transporter [Acetobacteraceae bacterium]|nr:LysE family transporter [Acetobacteraceae bacterium]